MEIRPATPADAEVIVATFAEGLETYREFAPAGWAPPAGALDVESQRARLADPGYWCMVAEPAAGHVAFQPSTATRWPDPAPELAHFSQLFVRAPWWGTGLAARLHGLAIAEAAARGFTAMRLYCAAGQSRARRFYEREGWVAAGEPFHEPLMGLAIVEYRIGL